MQDYPNGQNNPNKLDDHGLDNLDRPVKMVEVVGPVRVERPSRSSGPSKSSCPFGSLGWSVSRASLSFGASGLSRAFGSSDLSRSLGPF